MFEGVFAVRRHETEGISSKKFPTSKNMLRRGVFRISTRGYECLDRGDFPYIIRGPLLNS